MVVYAWHSRIVIVGCERLYAHFGLFQSGGLVDVLAGAACTFCVILGLLVPATVLLQRSRAHSLFGL